MTPQRPSSFRADTKPLYTTKFGRIKIFLALLLCCGTLQAKDIGLDITTATSACSGGCTVAARAVQVTFIFSTDFVGTIDGDCFAGTAGVCNASFSPADLTITVKARSGDTLMAIPYTISAGTARILRLQ